MVKQYQRAHAQGTIGITAQTRLKRPYGWASQLIDMAVAGLFVNMWRRERALIRPLPGKASEGVPKRKTSGTLAVDDESTINKEDQRDAGINVGVEEKTSSMLAVNDESTTINKEDQRDAGIDVGVEEDDQQHAGHR